MEKDHILYIDDEIFNLEVFRTFYENSYHVHLAERAEEVYPILEKHEIKVLISDQRMPDITGVELIQQVKAQYPELICIILTGFIDNDALLSSINQADVFRFILKPWDAKDLSHTLANAIGVYNIQKEKQKLIHDLQAARLKVLESDRLKTAFLANLSHEIKTPLNGILGLYSIMTSDGFSIDKMAEYKGAIQDSCDQLIRVVDDIIKTSELQTGNIENSLEVLDLNVFFQRMYSRFLPLAQRKGLALSLKGLDEGKELIFRTDKAKLLEIMSQLLNNAFKFTSTGSIEFGIDKQEESILFVKDTGCGIAKNMQESIFQPFRQESEEFLSRSHGGNGLGLSIAKGFVEMAGGKIWVESEKGMGASFFFTFPMEIVAPDTEKQGPEDA